MKIILNIEPITYPLTGIGRYTYELAREFERYDDFDELLYWSWCYKCDELPTLANVSSSTLESQKTPVKFLDSFKGAIKKRLVKSELAVKAAVGIKDGITGLRLSKYPDFIYHGPNFYLPPFPGRKVATFHDMSIISVPEHHPKSRVETMKRVLDSSINKADTLITVSNFSKQEIIAKTGFPSDSIKVTYLAAADYFKPRNNLQLAEKLSVYGLKPFEYTLFLGTVEPRKNVELLLDAYEKMPSQLRRRYPLVISGHEGWKSEQIHQRIKYLSRDDWLIYTGFVPAVSQPFLMAGAKLFLFPSFYEGFGLPPLEAMQCGIPTIVSNQTALPEIVGNSALCLSPFEPLQWRDWIVRLLEDDNLYKDFSQKAIKRASVFSWQRCARETIAVYNWVVSK